MEVSIIREVISCPNLQFHVTTLLEAVQSHHAAENYSGALEFLARARSECEADLGGKLSRNLQFYFECFEGDLFLSMDDYEEASYHFEVAAEISSTFPIGHPDRALTFILLATVYYYKEQYDEAIAALEEAKSIRETILSPEHIDTALVYHNLAVCSYKKDNPPEAQLYLNKAVDVFVMNLGYTHPRTNLALGNKSIIEISNVTFSDILLPKVRPPKPKEPKKGKKKGKGKGKGKGKKKKKR
ncbi:hypothetical protein PCE1_004443 [Barthelona sp. PCE]